MDATVAVKFWACSKQSHKGRRGGRSLTGRPKEAGGRHTHRRGRRMDARWSAIGRPVNKGILLWTLCIDLSDASAFLVPPLCLLCPTSSVHWEITVATTVPPFGNHSNPWATLAMVLPPFCLLCVTCYATTTALVVQGRHKGRAAAVTQKRNFLSFGDHRASWPFFWSLKGGTKVADLCKGSLTDTRASVAVIVTCTIFCIIQRLLKLHRRIQNQNEKIIKFYDGAMGDIFHQVLSPWDTPGPTQWIL